MKKTNIDDVADEYDDMVGYESDLNLAGDLSVISGVEKETTPKIGKPKKNEVFSEDWQMLYINFETEEDYIKFMKTRDMPPLKKIQEMIYNDDKSDLTSFWS